MSNQSSQSFGNWVGQSLLFSNELESDIREPFFTFRIPGLILQWMHLEVEQNKFGIMAPSVKYWTGIAFLLFIGGCLTSIFSCLIYQLIIIPRKQRKRKQRNRRNSDDEKEEDSATVTTNEFFVGFGLLMPLILISPYHGLRYFCVKNKMMKFVASLGSLTSFFHCSEAVFGFLPQYTDDSLINFLIYNAFPVEVKFNSDGPVRAPWSNIAKNLVKFGYYLCLLGAFSSFLTAYDYEPFSGDIEMTSLKTFLLSGVNYRRLLDNFAIAILFQLYLTTFSYAISALGCILGVQQIQMMMNPLFESSSPSDFWGRKWNMVVHGFLKRGVYKPIRKKYPAIIASVATFIASGIFHEWLLSVVFLPNNMENGAGDACISPSCYKPRYGWSVLFFIWNAFIIGIEFAVSRATIFQYLKKNLPLTLLSILVVFSGIPVAHWFAYDYIRSDFFEDAQIGLPLIVRIDE